MTSSRIRASVVSERIAWIREMRSSIQKLSLASFEQFRDDSRFDQGRQLLPEPEQPA